MNRKIRDYIELVRPFTLLAPFIGFVSGAIIASGAYAIELFLKNLLIILCGGVSAVFLNSASNVINQIFDLEIDKINKGYRPIPSGRVSLKEATILAIFLYFFSLFFAGIIPNKQFFWIVVITAFITYGYSGLPFRTKRFGFLANLTIALPRGCLLIVAGWGSLYSVWHLEPWIYGLVFGLYLFGAASTKDFADIRGDAQYGIKTLPIIYGVKKAAMIMAPFFIFPFFLPLIALFFGLVKGNPILISFISIILCIWGGYTVYLILRNPNELTLEANHISWKHMYLMLIFGQVGFAISYLIN